MVPQIGKPIDYFHIGFPRSNLSSSKRLTADCPLAPGTLKQFCSACIWLHEGKAYWFDGINDAAPKGKPFGMIVRLKQTDAAQALNTALQRVQGWLAPALLRRRTFLASLLASVLAVVNWGIIASDRYVSEAPIVIQRTISRVVRLWISLVCYRG